MKWWTDNRNVDEERVKITIANELFSDGDVSVTQWPRSMTLSFILLRKRA